jgi:hypothetical protein
MQFLIKISWFAFILISLVCSQNSNNDTIIKNDDTVIIGKVIRVTETTVEFNPEGEKPFIIIDRNDINVLIYSDHTVVNFKTPQTKHVSNLKNNSQLETLEWKLDTLYYHNPQNITQWGIVPECYRIDKYNFPDKPEFPIQANFTTLAKISARIQDKLVMFSTKDEVYKSSSTSLYYIDENNEWQKIDIQTTVSLKAKDSSAKIIGSQRGLELSELVIVISFFEDRLLTELVNFTLPYSYFASNKKNKHTGTVSLVSINYMGLEMNPTFSCAPVRYTNEPPFPISTVCHVLLNRL